MLGIEYLLRTEKETIARTRAYLRGIHENVPGIIDTLFKLPYHTGELGDPETVNGSFLSLCKSTYMQTPYTFWSLYQLYEKGYYLETVILYRHLLEAFVQLRYFHKFPDKLVDHINQSKRVNFSAMFNEFSPGFYKSYYSRQLSEASHGFIFKDIYRVTRDSSGARRTVMGCEFNVDHATYTMNATIPLLYGFINWFSRFFTNYSYEEEFQTCVEHSIEWLRSAMASHKKAHPRSEQWLKHFEAYIL